MKGGEGQVQKGYQNGHAAIRTWCGNHSRARRSVFLRGTRSGGLGVSYMGVVLAMGVVVYCRVILAE
jgi:hypothetical protein